MNVKAVLVCLFAVVSLAAEASGDKRKWLLTFLTFSVLLSLIPTFMGLREFFMSPRSKVRRIKKAFWELVRDVSFAEWEGRRRLKGKGIYCHQGYDTTVNCTHKTHMVVTLVGITDGVDTNTLANANVRNLEITYPVNAVDVIDESNEGLTLRRTVRKRKPYAHTHAVTYVVDIAHDIAPDSWTSFKRDKILKMKYKIDIGDLNVTFRFYPDQFSATEPTEPMETFNPDQASATQPSGIISHPDHVCVRSYPDYNWACQPTGRVSLDHALARQTGNFRPDQQRPPAVQAVWDSTERFPTETRRSRNKTTNITIKIRGAPEHEKIQISNWGFPEAIRFMSYLAYWKKRDCCGLLLTRPYKKGKAMILNICTVQELIMLAESGRYLLRKLELEKIQQEDWKGRCIVEGEPFGHTRRKLSL